MNTYDAVNSVVLQTPLNLECGTIWRGAIEQELNAIAKRIQQEIGPFPDMSTEKMTDLLSDELDLSAVKIEIANRYTDYFCNWLDETMEIDYGSSDLKFLRLKSVDFIHITAPIETINRLWAETDRGVMDDVLKELFHHWVRLVNFDASPLHGNSLSEWLAVTKWPENWDEVQLGLLLIAWIRTKGMFSRDVERLIYGQIAGAGIIRSIVNRNLDMDAVKCKLPGATRMEFDKDVVCEDDTKKKIERLAGSFMTDQHWVKNAVEWMQESLIGDNEDVIDLVASSVKLYQKMPQDEAEILHFLCSVKPFWNIIKAHAHKEAAREIEGDVFND